MIVCHHITKSFSKLPALNDISFAVPPEKIFGIVGADGAGKSTLLRILAGILPPDNGTVSFDGIDIYPNNMSIIKEKLAYMPQRFGLYEDLTVEENILFFGKIFGLARKEMLQRMERLYAFSRLGPFHDRLAGALSGGMKQKLGLSCCLIHRPELLILDEPTNGVDPVSRREFWDILYDLLLEKVTIVISTSYLDEAERCNTLAMMHHGTIIRSGTPAEIKINIRTHLFEIQSNDPRQAEIILKNRFPQSTIRRTGRIIRLFIDGKEKENRSAIYTALRTLHDPKMIIREIDPGLEDCFLNIVTHERHA